jgi:ribosomal-protein-alanine N-acetyltransferase
MRHEATGYNRLPIKGLSIREARAGDIMQIYELDQLCFHPELAFDFDTFCHYLLHTDSITYLIEKKDRICGCITAISSSPAKAQLVTIDIHPHYRRRGLGQALLNKMEQELIRRKIKWLSLEVAVNNETAIAFYLKNNYCVKQILKDYYQNGIDAQLMSKRL